MSGLVQFYNSFPRSFTSTPLLLPHTAHRPCRHALCAPVPGHGARWPSATDKGVQVQRCKRVAPIAPPLPHLQRVQDTGRGHLVVARVQPGRRAVWPAVRGKSRQNQMRNQKQSELRSSQAAVERTFSNAGRHCTKDRCKMLSKTLMRLVFLNRYEKELY